ILQKILMVIYLNITHKRYFDKVYVFVNIEYNEEFSLEFLNKENRKKFINNLKEYVIDNFNKNKEDYIVLAINGILIGTVATSIFFNSDTLKVNNINTQTEISSEYSTEKKKINEEIKKDNLENIAVKLEDKVDTNNIKVPVNNVVTKPVVKPVVKPVNKPVTKPVNKPVAKPVTPPIVNNGINIKLNDNGVIKTMNLEEYIIGVVAAEMPASFNIEALKAQAVAARTFAMKKVSNNITLVNSTAHQVYKSNTKLKAIWGSSYNTYYNKVSSAVNSTKGLVIKSNGTYIDALYHSISNGKTELPKYIWGNSASYLQSVNSSMDKNVKNFMVNTNFSYNTLSSKLGTTVNKDTKIEVLSKTVSGRVLNIKINDKVFSGVKVRSLLRIKIY
ncbi:MAG: SpoIID/LytB domain-containing protein, partial [Clostridia bacterium]